MYKITIKGGKIFSVPVNGIIEMAKKNVDKLFNIINVDMKKKNNGAIVLTSALSKYWDPHNDLLRVELMEHLDATLPLAIYTTAFPELTVGVLTAIHNIAVMGKYVLTGTGIAASDMKRDTAYKHAFFDGPITTDMSAVIVATGYGTIATAVPADAMKYIGDLRTVLMKNKNWNEAIAKALWLYGIDGTPFIPADYVAHYSVHAFPGYLHFHVATKFVHTHNLYIRKAGALIWEPAIRFDGPNYDVHRITTSSPEDLEVMIKGIVDNVETPLFSLITKVTYT